MRAVPSKRMMALLKVARLAQGRQAIDLPASALFRGEDIAGRVQRLLAEPDHRFTPREELAFVLDRAPRFAAGQGFEYSDTNYVLLGLVLEQIAGKVIARHGGSVSQDVTITINGTNDAAVISSAGTTGSVTEDVGVDGTGHINTGGTLSVTDVDAGQAGFQALGRMVDGCECLHFEYSRLDEAVALFDAFTETAS